MLGTSSGNANVVNDAGLLLAVRGSSETGEDRLKVKQFYKQHLLKCHLLKYILIWLIWTIEPRLMKDCVL